MPSPDLQENSQARLCQLDTTVARRNRPVKSRRGLRQAPRGRGKRRPAQARRIHHAKESLEEARTDRKEIPADAQGIKGTRVAAARLSQGGEDRRPPIPVRDPTAAAEDCSCQPERQRGERSSAEPGRNTLRCLQLRSDQQWEEEIPLEPPRKIPRENERISLAGEQSEQGTKRGPQFDRTRHPAPHADEQRRRPSSGRHDLSRPPAGRTGHGSDKEEQTPEMKPPQKGLLLHPKQKGTAEPPPRMQKQQQLPYFYDRSQGRGPRQVHKKPGGARTTGGNAEAALPTNRGVTAAYISKTTGGWATATVTTPSRSSRLARQPLFPDRERTEERSDCTRDR